MEMATITVFQVKVGSEEYECEMIQVLDSVEILLDLEKVSKAKPWLQVEY